MDKLFAELRIKNLLELNSAPQELFHVSLRQWMDLLDLDTEMLAEYMEYPEGCEELTGDLLPACIDQCRLISFCLINFDSDDYQALMQEVMGRFTIDQREELGRDFAAGKLRESLCDLGYPFISVILSRIFSYIDPNYFDCD